MASTAEKASSSSVESVSSERRRHMRFPLTANVEVTESKSGARITGRTSDLGLGGCYVDVITPFPLGTDAKIRITRGKESFEAQARVVYSQMGMGMGLAFVSAQPEQIRLFQRWILEISGKLTPTSNEPDHVQHEGADVNLKVQKDYVLSELLISLMGKGVLTEAEGKAMLKKLHQ